MTWSRRAAGALALSIGLSGCSRSEDARPSLAPPDAIPESLAIPASDVELGVALGVRRQMVKVATFRVSKFPTTVSQYDKCVALGHCTPPSERAGACAADDQGVDGATYAPASAQQDSLAGSVPVTCTSAEQAQRYCRWVGGRLARVDEWLLAARGPAVRRFAWGDTTPTCQQHWRVALTPVVPLCCADCTRAVAAAVGLHSVGESAFGVADVLGTPAELMSARDDVVISGCTGRGSMCWAHGLVPGAIDTIQGVSPGPAGFRCVWEV